MDSYGNRSMRPNLESLTEVTEHHYNELRNPPINVNQEIPNAEKFDSLIDNVLTSFSEVQLSVQELMQLKDDVLMYYLPPPLLFRMAVVFGKVFRNFSDLNTPVTEMLRLVKIFSASWEKNAAILKKLNDMYENKKQLLNIAIKRLSTVEKKTKLFAREKRIQNWEKLFIKLSEAKGHGRRWKFQIETFRKKANLGYEELMKWLTSEEESQNELQQNDGDDMDEENNRANTKKIDRKNMKSASKKRHNHFNNDLNMNDDDFDFNKHDNSIDEIDSDKELFTDDEDEKQKKSEENTNKKEVIDVNIQTEPYVDHQSTWTGEPNYKRYIVVRLFKPSEYMLKKLKFKIKFQNQMITSNSFDPPKVDSKTSKKPNEAKDKKKVKGKTSVVDQQNELQLDDIKEEETNNANAADKNKIIVTKYQDFLFEISDFVQKNDATLSADVNSTDKCFYVEMNSEDKDHIGGYSHIQLDDIHTLDLPILYYKANEEAEVVDHYDSKFSSNQNKKEDSKMDNSNWLKLNDLTTESADMYTMLSKRTPFSFEMYAMNKAKTGNNPICKLPLMFFWIRKPSLLTRDKNTGTMSINDLMNEMALLNNLMPKKQEEQTVPIQNTAALPPLPPQIVEAKKAEQFDKMCSPIKDLINRPSSSRIGSVAKSNDDLQEVHNAEIEIIKENYEMNIEQLNLRIMNLENELNTLRSLHELNLENQQNNFKLRAKLSKDSISTTVTKENLKQTQKLSNKQNQIYTRDIPQDFFDRLKLFNERSTIHHKEIIEKYLREEAAIREQQMAVQHRLDQNRDNQNTKLEDFCLPAVFMPFRSSNNVFNPRAHQYFHPMGSNDPRLTQPPSVFQLPPLPSKTSLSVINLFEMGKRYQAGEVDFYLNNNNNSKLVSNTTTTAADANINNNNNNIKNNNSIFTENNNDNITNNLNMDVNK